uniref:WD_REPEATS_REGION domain-containing protein n=1 Tax=Steinernema glaseri TaxID=37863 RepID=A0A1I7Y037_9BILA
MHFISRCSRADVLRPILFASFHVHVASHTCGIGLSVRSSDHLLKTCASSADIRAWDPRGAAEEEADKTTCFFRLTFLHKYKCVRRAVTQACTGARMYGGGDVATE